MIDDPRSTCTKSISIRVVPASHRPQDLLHLAILRSLPTRSSDFSLPRYSPLFTALVHIPRARLGLLYRSINYFPSFSLSLCSRVSLLPLGIPRKLASRRLTARVEIDSSHRLPARALRGRSFLKRMFGKTMTRRGYSWRDAWTSVAKSAGLRS